MIPPVVDVHWELGRREEVVLADVRWYPDGRSGRQAYDAGHLPGAVFVDLERWLSGPAGPHDGRHPLPDPHVFAEATAHIGIADRDVVVAYDDVGGVVAARLVWMLRVTGDEAALLDGGMNGYDGPLEQVTPARPVADFTARPWPRDRLADIDDATDPANVVLDARDRERYRGEHEPFDPRPGHIPGTRNVPCRENLDVHGRFLPVDRLRRVFAAAGVRDASNVVSYCGSGVTACHNLPRARAGRTGSRSAVSGLVVAVQPGRRAADSLRRRRRVARRGWQHETTRPSVRGLSWGHHDRQRVLAPTVGSRWSGPGRYGSRFPVVPDACAGPPRLLTVTTGRW